MNDTLGAAPLAGRGKALSGCPGCAAAELPRTQPNLWPVQARGNLVSLSLFASHRGHLAMAVDGWKSWELAISAGQRDPNSAAPSRGAAEALFLPLFILLVANQPHFLFPAPQMGNKPLAKSFTRVAGFTS